MTASIGRRSPQVGMAGRDFRLLMVATFAAFVSFAPLFSIAPLWAAVGGAGSAGIGAVTGVKMVGTVLTQLTMGWWLRLLSLRQMFALGGLLIGPPTAVYALSPDLSVVLPVSAVRGVGFAFIVVSGSALVAELVPLAERGRAIGRYGVAVGLPMVAFLPLGVWTVDQVGFELVFWLTAAIGLVVVPMALAIRVPDEHAERPDGGRVLRGSGPLLPPWLLMIVAATALGGAMSFVPLALADPTAAALTLFVITSAMVLGRIIAGVWQDRARQVGGLLPAAVVASALGMLGLGLAIDLPTGSAIVALVAGTVYGLGFGAIQNETLVVMFHRAGPGGTGRASTVWNIGYDAGLGAGSFAVGLLAALADLRGAFVITAVIIALAFPVALRQAHR